MTLLDALDGQEYIIKKINTDDEELNAFLFSLGCYVGEPVAVVSHLKGGCVVSIKDGRYNIDNQLASAIDPSSKPCRAALMVMPLSASKTGMPCSALPRSRPP